MKKLLLAGLKAAAIFVALLAGFIGVAQSAQAAEPQAAPSMVQTGGYLAGNSVGDEIARAAENQVGASQDCTMLVTNALAAAGIHFHDWPAGYMSLGAIDDQAPQRGDLIYYANGGMGMPHIAVYLGNGQAVHGGYNGDLTVRAGLNMGQYGGFRPTHFIRVSGGTPAPQPAPAPAPAPAPGQIHIETVSAVQPSGVQHVVAPGETLSSIASATGIGDWHALLAANPQISNPNAVAVGQQLNLPVSAPAPQAGSNVHVVAPGETLSSIAASAGLGDWHVLWAANPQLSNPNLVYAGQQLSIPTQG